MIHFLFISCDNGIELAILDRKFRAGARIAVTRKGGGDNFSNKKGNDSDIKGRLEAKDTWLKQRSKIKEEHSSRKQTETKVRKFGSDK